MSPHDLISASCWLLVPFSLLGIEKYYRAKKLGLWSFRRRYYFICEVMLALAILATALRLLITYESYREFAEFGPAIISLLMAALPCGLPRFRQPGWKLLRNFAFVAAAAFYLALALLV